MKLKQNSFDNVWKLFCSSVVSVSFQLCGQLEQSPGRTNIQCINVIGQKSQLFCPLQHVRQCISKALNTASWDVGRQTMFQSFCSKFEKLLLISASLPFGGLKSLRELKEIGLIIRYDASPVLTYWSRKRYNGKQAHSMNYRSSPVLTATSRSYTAPDLYPFLINMTNFVTPHKIVSQNWHKYVQRGLPGIYEKYVIALLFLLYIR